MILFSAEYLKNKGEAITYEFDDVDKYLKLCEKYQIKETSECLIESLNLLNELTADIAMFNYKEVYIFYNQRNRRNRNFIYI